MTSSTSSSSLGPAATAPTTSSPAKTRRVVDAPTRTFHALFALSFFGAYLTAESERWRALHVTLGYTMAGLLAFRVLYGLAPLCGPRHAGLGLLWRKLDGLPAWLRTLASAVAQGRITGLPWRQGQNLLMALAVCTLLVLALPLTLSGYATYAEWFGGEALEEVHEFFGNAMLAVVLAHLALVLGLSLARRRNLALPMLTGRIEGTGPDLVRRNGAWLAALLLSAVLAFGAWQWTQFPNGLLPARASAGAQDGQREAGAGRGHDSGHGSGHERSSARRKERGRDQGATQVRLRRD